ncbi:HPP family protein [Methanohalobium sp.]|uniref:CBS domain-containing protein n=1 Tax=Methanohalobium sp. TaxID=2837493 RepID=UPI0025D30ACF|nr:CBS domain-containing protein [Methanohalobium sp.]
MTVEDIMSSPVYVVKPNDTVAHARNLMLKHKINTLIVVDDEEEMVGIVTMSDLSRKKAQSGPTWKRRPVDDILIDRVMTESPLTIYSSASISQAISMILENHISSLPVMKNKVAGIITRIDIVRYISENSPLEGNVSEWMTKNPIFVHRHHTINHVIDEMEKSNIHKLLVVNDVDETVGMISTRDLALNTLKDDEGKLQSKEIKMARKPETGGQRVYRDVEKVSLVAEDIMSTQLHVIDSSDSLNNAAKIMIDENVLGLPVRENEDIAGIISRSDILRAIQNQLSE